MKQATTYPLRLPRSLKDAVSTAAKRDGTSINQFIAIAVAEKLASLEAETFFTERKQRADLDGLRDLLSNERGETPRQGDELPAPTGCK